MLFMGRLTQNLSFLQHIDSLLVTIIANGDMTIKRNFIPCYVTGTVLYVVSITPGSESTWSNNVEHVKN